ncbi:MAG: Lrp/AsnC family transcriptional regulator [Gammaproteobacteria bacterium]|nr:Lrp/AsnC family transcriptional regulator [Gammaproteobacteria bacterium]
MKFDAIDGKILNILQTKADVSMHELGEAVELSHTPCWRRVKKLEEQGFIKQRVTLLDPVTLDLSVNVIVNVTLRHHQEKALERFEREVMKIEEVVECYSVSGETDFLLRVVVRNVQEYEKLLREKLIHLPEVGNLSSTFALRQVKYTTALPISSVELNLDSVRSQKNEDLEHAGMVADNM